MFMCVCVGFPVCAFISLGAFMYKYIYHLGVHNCVYTFVHVFLVVFKYLAFFVYFPVCSFVNLFGIEYVCGCLIMLV